MGSPCDLEDGVGRRIGNRVLIGAGAKVLSRSKSETTAASVPRSCAYVGPADVSRYAEAVKERASMRESGPQFEQCHLTLPYHQQLIIRNYNLIMDQLTLSVPLLLEETSGIPRFAEPVTVGVPLPRGAVFEPVDLGLVDYRWFDGGNGPARFQAVLRLWESCLPARANRCQSHSSESDRGSPLKQ
jgi:hypothetical protein